MFDFLKKKIGGFIDGLTKKEEAKEGAPAPREEALEAGVAEEASEEKIEAIGTPKAKPPAPQKKAEAPKKAAPEKAREAESSPKIGPAQPEKAKAPPAAEKTLKVGVEPKKKEQPREAEPAPKKTDKPVPKDTDEEPDFLKEISKPEQKPPEPPIAETEEPGPPIPETEPEPVRMQPQKPAAPIEMEKPKERIKLGIVGTVKSIITREVEITEKDVGEMLDSLELELLEADVDLTVAEGIKAELREKLLGAKVKKDDLHSYVREAIRGTLIAVLTNERAFDIPERADSAEKPLKIAFLGINGAGKTTTIAKVAKLLMDRKKKVVFAAADTFRAAAIEQMGVHADRLGVKVIKRDYGSDPTSVAYDAVNYARAHGIDAVLIDTAGRQDTNISLINEMKKLDRVIKPDIKIYVGESIAGNAIIEQVSAFNREIGIDAVILTKLDCDPKGGTMLSISKATGIPIIYVGVGQGYDELEKFEPGRIVDRIVD